MNNQRYLGCMSHETCPAEEKEAQIRDQITEYFDNNHNSDLNSANTADKGQKETPSPDGFFTPHWRIRSPRKGSMTLKPLEEFQEDDKLLRQE